MCLIAAAVAACQEEQLRDVIFKQRENKICNFIADTPHYLFLIFSTIDQNSSLKIVTFFCLALLSLVLTCSMGNRDSSVGIATTVRAKFDSWQVLGDCSSTGPRSITLSDQKELFAGIKRPDREATHPPAYRAEIKNE